MENIQELEITKCCGTTCDKQKAVDEFYGSAETIAKLMLTVKLLTDSLEGHEIPLKDMSKDADMVNYLKVNMPEHGLCEGLLLAYTKAFRREWSQIDLSS